MSEIEVQIQKYLINFVKALPAFVEKWKDFVKDVTRPVQGLVNQAEQMRHVESANLNDVEDFSEMQQRVLFKIYEAIEDEISIIKDLVDKMNKINSDLKNKLTLLENATLNLNWDDEASLLIRGSATQPALGLLLDYALDFWIFFSTAARNINNSLRFMNARDARSMNDLENSFKVNLDNKSVLRLIAITQYIDNEKTIT